MATTDIYHIAGDLRKARRAVAFLGGAVDDAVEVDEWAVARVAAGDVAGTITAWVNVPDITGDYAVISAGDTAAIEFLTLRVTAGKVVAECNDATTDQWEHTTTNVVIKPHRWHHVALVQNATKSAPKIYIDGVQVATTQTLGTDNSAWFGDLALTDDASIGAAEEDGAGSLTREFKGAIGAVKYWSAELTAAQVADDYYGKDPDTINLSAGVSTLTDWWAFDGDYVNSITAGNNGTAAGDIILTPYYSEFTSRLRYTTGVPVVADTVQCFAENGVGHAVIIQAA